MSSITSSRVGPSSILSAFNNSSIAGAFSSGFTDDSESSSSSSTPTSSANVNSATISQPASPFTAVQSATSAPVVPATDAPSPPPFLSSIVSTSVSTTPSTPSGSGIPKTDIASSSSGLGQGGIAIIVSLSLLFLLGLVACIVFFLRRRRRRLSEGQSGSGPRHIGFEEKYADESHYAPYSAPYSTHRKSESDLGMAPLLRIPSLGQFSRVHSDSDTESHLYQDGPTSPFTNEGESIPQTNAVSLTGATPSQSQDGYFDAVSLLPVAEPSSSRSVPKLHSLQIPEYSTPPARRPSKGKSPSNILDPGYDSDDSASLYSQASASTLRTTKSYVAIRQSTIQALQYPSMPLPSIPQSPSNKPPVPIRTGGEPIRESVATLQTPPEFNLNREEESNGGLGTEEALLVAKLLQSRQSRAPNAAPTRNFSIVSHIERANSIKPVLASTGRGVGSRFTRARRARDMVNSQTLSHSPTDYTTSAYLAYDATGSVPSHSPTTTVAPLNIYKTTRTE